jgi:hypothetical protein
MDLDTETRGLLDKIIDNVVKTAGETVKVFFNPEPKKDLHIQNENDFAYGFALGMIQQTFLTGFLVMHMRIPNEGEKSEIGQVIFRRLAEVRDAIFKAG